MLLAHYLQDAPLPPVSLINTTIHPVFSAASVSFTSTVSQAFASQDQTFSSFSFLQVRGNARIWMLLRDRRGRRGGSSRFGRGSGLGRTHAIPPVSSAATCRDPSTACKNYFAAWMDALAFLPCSLENSDFLA